VAQDVTVMLIEGCGSECNSNAHGRLWLGM